MEAKWRGAVVDKRKGEGKLRVGRAGRAPHLPTAVTSASVKGPGPGLDEPAG